MRASEYWLNLLRLRPLVRNFALIVVVATPLALGGCAAGIVFGDEDDRCQGSRSDTGECRPAT